MNALRNSLTGAFAVLTLAVTGCGSTAGAPNPAATYTLGGTVLGLNSNQSVTVLNGTDSLTVTHDGSFTLPTAIGSQANYAVTLGTPPTGQGCGVLAGSGTVEFANVTNIEVYCTDTVSAATLNGTYEFAAFNINNDTDLLYAGVPFNGGGVQGISTVMSNQAGTTFATSTDGGGPYTVTTVEALPVLTIGTNNIGAIAGADGDEFYWLVNAVNTVGSPPALALGVKPLQTATTASLAGNWISVSLTQAATPYVSEATLAINADGSYTGSETSLDVTGASGTQAVGGAAGSFSVTNTVVSASGNSGYISANGEFLFLTAVTQQPGGASANSPGLTAAVKQGTGVTLATLSGVYSIGSLAFATAGTGDGETITVFFDGAGNFSGSFSQNANGVFASNGTWMGTYTVTSAGVVTLTDSHSAVYAGGVSADGNIFVAATLTAGGSEAPQMFAGFRQ
jgi:hypothetical protein